MPGSTPTKQEMKALGSFCEVERQLQEFTAQNRLLNRELMASRKNAMAAVVHMMETNGWSCVALDDELRAATNAKYVRASKTHTTKNLSDKFVAAVLLEHFDELTAPLDAADSPEAAAAALREAMWELLKEKRIKYSMSVDFSNNKPRAVTAADVVKLDAVGEGDRLASALHAMHTARAAFDDNRRRTRDMKARTEEERAKFYDKVKHFMERTETKKQVIQAVDGSEFTLKYTTARKTLPLSANECQNAIEAAVDAFMQANQGHIMQHGLRGGFLARQKESVVELLLSEMKQRRAQTQKAVVRLMRRRSQAGDDDADEDSDAHSEEGEEDE
jgi:hypothetical protein